jgi:hypothetical protein
MYILLFPSFHISYSSNCNHWRVLSIRQELCNSNITFAQYMAIMSNGVVDLEIYALINFFQIDFLYDIYCPFINGVPRYGHVLHRLDAAIAYYAMYTMYTVHIHIGTLFAKSDQTVPSLNMHRSFSAKNKPSMDNNPVKFHCNWFVMCPFFMYCNFTNSYKNQHVLPRPSHLHIFRA